MLTTQMKDLLKKFSSQHLLRTRFLLENQDEFAVKIAGKKVLHFCSNDYLNLSKHPKVKKALADHALSFGLGSGASAMVSGYSKAHQALEEAFAAFLNRERALLFNSGYHANLGVLTTFAEKKSFIAADKYCHASLIDGMVLSRANFKRYHHNDPAHAESLLTNSSSKTKLLLTESVFSMHGDIAKLTALSQLAKDKSAFLIVDDAHGIGALGEKGAGICDHFNLNQNEVPCLITPLGKAFGSMGAIVSGSHLMIETLLQTARTYRYSTALPPAICHATLTVLHILQKETWRKQKLAALIQFFLMEAKKRHLPLFSEDETPVKSILVACNQKASHLQKKLLEKNLFVSCIRPPTVPPRKACLRISLNCAHSEKQVIYLLDLIAEYL